MKTLKKRKFVKNEDEYKNLKISGKNKHNNNNKIKLNIYIILLIISLASNLIFFIFLNKEKTKNKKLIKNYLENSSKLNDKNEIYNEKNNETINEKKKKNIEENNGKNSEKNKGKIYVPFLPPNINDRPIKEYSKISYDTSNIRYHLNEIYSNRTLFKIDYSYLPYTKINKLKSYEENAQNIYELTGMLNITLLDFYYNNIDIDKTNFNHIHLSMGFDANYILVSSISIASLLNTSSPDTFIHLHIILNNCTYEDVKPIVDLKKINNNIEFIFYNGKQAEYDFGERAKQEWRGVGDYARVLIPEIVNNTNRIVIIDSGDLLVNKDLSELYYFDIGDNYFVFSLDEYAGTSKTDIYFAKNNFYPNTGVCLINVRKFREDNLYRTSYFTSLAYSKLICPYQDIFIMISNYKFKFWGLNYNCPQFFRNKDEMDGTRETLMINSWFDNQISPYKYSKEELKEAALNPVITHLYHAIVQERWRKYEI